MVVAAMKHMASNFAKPDKFEGVDFRRWQKKMHFLLSSMSVVYVLTTPIPEDGDNATVEQLGKRAKWDNDDYVCRGLIINGMSDPLFDIYQSVQSSKELWDSLKAKYMVDDASSKKFIVSNFTNYNMTYSRPVMKQYNELLDILGRFTQHNMNMDEAIQEELTLVELGSHLRIEESLRAQDSDKPKGNNVVGPQLNIDNDIGHVHFKRVQDISKDRLILAFDIDTEKCKTCMLTKITKKLFQYVKRETKVLELIHSDLHVTPSLENKKYFVTFIDDASRTDRGGEYMDTLYFQSVGIIHETTALYTPQQNVIPWLSRDVIFGENRLSSVPRPSLSIPKGFEDIGGSVVSEKVTKEDDLKIFDEAMKSQNVAFWKEAINDEMDSIMGNNTWELVDLPPSYKPLVARIITIRLLIAMTSIHYLIIHQMDVKTTFLNGELDGEHAPKQSHQKFDEVVFSNGYLLSQTDKCVYRKFEESGKGVIIFLYVDDMLIFGTDQVQVDMTKEFLSSRFSRKDMGEADVILGIRIKHESNRITISQSYYIEKVLKKFNYFDCTQVSTPIDTSENLMPNNGQAVSQFEYSRMIGCLMYVITCTRSDIAFTVGKLSRYTSNPSTQHWQAIQRVLKYLKKTMDYRLTYTGYPSVLEGYTNASWISNTKDTSSISGWVFLLGGAASKEAECAATLAKAYSQMYNGKSRHLGARHSMIHELITNGVVSIEFVRSRQNLVDHLTKGLARDLVLKSAERMGLKSNKWTEAHVLQSSKGCAWNLLKRRMKSLLLNGSMDFGSYNIYELDMDTWLVYCQECLNVWKLVCILSSEANSNNGHRTDKRSYVNVVNGDTKSTEACEPALLLDESCLNQLDYYLVLLGKYMGGMWIMIDFKTEDTKAKFQSCLGATSWFSLLIQASKEFVIDERITWVDIEGIPLKLWSESTFNRIAAKWGKMLYLEKLDEGCLYSKRLCILTTGKSNILETFKIIHKGKRFLVRAKETMGWIPDFDEQEEDNSESEDEQSVGFIKEDFDGMSRERNVEEKMDKSNETVSIPFPPGFTPCDETEVECDKKSMGNNEGSGSDNEKGESVSIGSRKSNKIEIKRTGGRYNCYGELIKIPKKRSKLDGFLMSGGLLGVNPNFIGFIRWIVPMLCSTTYGINPVSSIFNGNDLEIVKGQFGGYGDFIKVTLMGFRVIHAIHGVDGRIDRAGNVGYTSIWCDIIKEMDRLASHGIDLISMMHKKIGNGSNTSFWKDRWKVYEVL
ncbi:zinc finger, CCHC-type containing protein [Tanacetum coccineum]